MRRSVQVVATSPHSRARRGFTAIECIVVCAVIGVLCSIAVPSAVGTRRALGASVGARHLVLVLREAQARAQASGARTAVQVAPDGSYEAAELCDGAWRVTERGGLLAAATTNYPGGRVEFGRSGWPLTPGTTTPRAGSFVLGTEPRTCTVVVQLTGCVRCR